MTADRILVEHQTQEAARTPGRRLDFIVRIATLDCALRRASETITQRRTIECRSTCLLVTISLCHYFIFVVILNNFSASDCYLLSCLSRTEMKFAVLWALVYKLRVYSFIYLQCWCCNENKIMTPVYISARKTDAGDTQTVARGE